MLKYLKKFILDILPSVAATIIGAYIVNHYVIPAAAPKNPAVETVAVDPALKPPATGNEKDSFSKGVAEKAAIEKTAEKAAEKSSDTNVTPDARKRAVPARAASARPAAPESTASVTEDHRDANELARAAIARLRTSDPARTTATAPQTPPVVAPPVATLVTAPASSTIPSSSAANDVFNAGTGAITAPPRAAPVRSADASRPTPPEAIPGAPPLELHDEADRPNRAATIADDVVSTAKSIFHVVLPRDR